MASTGEHDITQLVHARVDTLTRGSIFCAFVHGIEGYHELNLTLQAAGYDTSELHAAIKETLESVVKLKAVRDKAAYSGITSVKGSLTRSVVGAAALESVQ